MRLVGEVADVVGDPAVDVVVVITPPALHAEHVRMALEAGKHVLCEKPVGEGGPRPSRSIAWPPSAACCCSRRRSCS